MIFIVCLQVSNTRGLRCILPLLLGIVAVSGLGALITCLASRFTMMARLVMTLTMVNRLAFHNKAATLEHLHSLLLTASLLLLGLAILQVLDVRIISSTSHPQSIIIFHSNFELWMMLYCQHRLPCTSRRLGKLLHALLATGSNLFFSLQSSPHFVFFLCYGRLPLVAHRTFL